MIEKLHFSSSLVTVAFCTAERERGGGPIECYLTANEGENASPLKLPHTVQDSVNIYGLSLFRMLG